VDIWASMPRVASAELVAAPDPESSAVVRDRIVGARITQTARNAGLPNARLAGRRLRRLAAPTLDAQVRLVELGERYRLSGRGVERVLRVARTIADLASDREVSADHVAEAVRFRAADGLSAA